MPQAYICGNMEATSWYKDWFSSPYYHLLYQNRDDSEAFQFIKRLINLLQPITDATMLDVACGKGRHSKALAEMGFDVTGIDLSFSSIEAAKEFEDEHLHFYQHDMRLPFWINYYDFAFNFFTSFGYFKTRREHDNAIRTIAQSLKSNGIFVIDYLNAPYASTHLQHIDRKEIDGITFKITRRQDDTHFYKDIHIDDAEHPGYRHAYSEKVAKFSLIDFTEMFTKQGLQVQQVFGDYQLGNYNENDSPRLIIVAKKM
jgi:SAM-dependent methyltransferase